MGGGGLVNAGVRGRKVDFNKGDLILLEGFGGRRRGRNEKGTKLLPLMHFFILNL